jgi:hypothetical protein
LAKADDLPRQVEVKNIRFLSHVEEQGAPAALAMALNWSGVSSDAAALAPKLKGEGLQSEIIDEVHQRGRNAYPVTDLRSVLQELAAGHPVLVRQEPSGRVNPVWRYALVVGYDLDNKVLLVHSGRLEHLKLPFQVFEGNWQRADNWGVVVMAPNQPPASTMALAAFRNTPTAVAQAELDRAPTKAPTKAVTSDRTKVAGSAHRSQDKTKLAKSTAPAKTHVADTASTKRPPTHAKPVTTVASKTPSAHDPQLAAKLAKEKKDKAKDKQLATVPVDKPAATDHKPAAPSPNAPAKTKTDDRTGAATPTTKTRQAAIDPALARLLSVVPVAYQR